MIMLFRMQTLENIWIDNIEGQLFNFRVLYNPKYGDHPEVVFKY